MSQVPRRPDAEAERILAERARDLARPLAADDGPRGGTLEVVRVVLRGAPHALETRFVHEIAHLGHLTSVPGGPALLLGVMNLRGAIVPVFDLAELLGLSAAPCPEARPLAIVLGDAAPELAVQVDDALDVVTLSAASLSSAPTAATPGARTLLLGLAPDHSIVLDGGALLAEPRFSAPTGREA